jgi:hypothetical protein
MTRPVEESTATPTPSPVDTVETQPGYHAALTAFRIGDVPIVAARNEDSKTFQPQRCGLTSMTVIETLVVVGNLTIRWNIQPHPCFQTKSWGVRAPIPNLGQAVPALGTNGSTAEVAFPFGGKEILLCAH